MYSVQTATKENLPEVIKLINSVFISNWPASSRMEEKFPIFLSEANLDHIFIATHQGKPVSHAAYYKSQVLIQGFPIQVGSIGSVCTDPEYRGQGTASRILDALEENARSEGIQVLLISGERGLYLRRQCKQVGGFNEFTLHARQEVKTSPHPEIELVEYDPASIGAMANLYNQEPVRFYRSAEEFNILLKAGLCPFITTTNKAFLLKTASKIVAYFVLGIVHDDPMWGEVSEYAGDRQALKIAFERVLTQETLQRLLVRVPSRDPMAAFLQDGFHAVHGIHQVGTVKIINLVSFLQSLKPYFLQYVTPQVLDRIHWEEKDGQFYIIDGVDVGEIGDLCNLTQLIFGFAEDATCPEKFTTFLSTHPAAREFVHTALPIPMPWAGNMNFI
jgi:GNAT superfamily N-acetyltransferase